MSPARLGIALLLFACALPPPGARAETWHACRGFVASVPATITAQGVWCLRQDLSTAITRGAAITIAANNVTLDCNGYKLGGLAAGEGSQAVGILANSQNGTVRHCNVRGFRTGIQLSGDGHAVDDNRVDNSLGTGILVTGINNVIRRNRVYDTGQSTPGASAYGIRAGGIAVDNVVRSVSAIHPVGLVAETSRDEIRGNNISNLNPGSGGMATGIYVFSLQNPIVDNRVVTVPGTRGTGISGNSSSLNTFCARNIVSGFQTDFSDCLDAGGNASL